MAGGDFTDIPVYSREKTSASINTKSFSSFRLFYIPSTMPNVRLTPAAALVRLEGVSHYTDRGLREVLHCPKSKHFW